MSVVSLLVAASLLSAVATIGAHYSGQKALHYFFKPATTVCIIMLAFLLLPSIPSGYGYLILVGLIFSLAGDVFLMLPRDRFVAGLAAFLLAHWCYILAFLQRTPEPNLALCVPWLLVAAGVLLVLRPEKGFLRYAVGLYVVSITIMAWLAVENWRLAGHVLAAAGAILFMFSDFLIGLRRFRGSWHTERAMTLGTYFPAQLLIASSISQYS